jgi:hypothetical protein
MILTSRRYGDVAMMVLVLVEQCGVVVEEE